jgi:hypothetical protein
MSTTIRSVIDRSNTRKVVGSLALVGAAAAVAGLGTYGNFTDSSTPINTTVATGTLSIDVSQPGGAYAIPVSTANFVPGDSITRAVNLVNDGGADLGSVQLSSSLASGTPNVLTTDAVNGLQLAVRKCSVAWTQTGTAQAPSYSCSGTQTTILSGPAINTAGLNNPAALIAGGSDYLTFTVSLPSTAGNSFQGLSAQLNLVFTGTQRAAQTR